MISRIKLLSIGILGIVSFTWNITAQDPNDVCSKRGEICTTYSNCVNARALLKNRTYVICKVENYGPGLCCKVLINPLIQNGKSKNATTLFSESSTSTVVSLTSPIQPLPTLSSQFKENTTVQSENKRWSSKDSKAIALNYCKKYTQYKYEQKWKNSSVPGRPGEYYNKTSCVIEKRLIVNGVPALPKQYPHMALIGYGNSFKEVNWGCGGSLISDKFILSAAHCGSTGRLGTPRWALLGDLNITSNTDDAKPAVYSIVRVHDHPYYKNHSTLHDISLFELNTTVSLSPYVRPACLYTLSSDPSVGTSCRITGWGLKGTVEKRSDHLLGATIKVIADGRCKNSFPHYNSTTMVCAGDLATGKDTCNGDSGGPLQLIKAGENCMWDVFGVTSHGDFICGNQEDPSVYTKVRFYLDWIQSIVWP